MRVSYTDGTSQGSSITALVQRYRLSTPPVGSLIDGPAGITSGSGIDGWHDGSKQTLAVVNTTGLHTVFSGLLCPVRYAVFVVFMYSRTHEYMCPPVYTCPAVPGHLQARNSGVMTHSHFTARSLLALQ